MDELIEKLPELYKNILYLERMLNSSNKEHKEIAKDLIMKGICFARYQIGNRVLFAPSRFIGYKNNNLSNHLESKTKHGSNTNNRIKKILNRRAECNKKVEKEFFNFCEEYQILPNEKASFGNERKFWDLDTIQTNIYGDVELPEGKMKLVIHQRRERNPRIRELAIENFLKKNHKLFCQACEFEFEIRYGVLGKGFIECHHTIPLSKMEEGHKSKPEDLLLLCSNCHRMIHIRQPWLTLNQLKKIIIRNRVTIS